MAAFILNSYMIKISLNFGSKNYDINIGKGILQKRIFDKSIRYAIITDSNVRKLCGESLQNLLKKQGADVAMLDFTAGEESKTRETKALLEAKLFEMNYDADSMIIALGGGVVGDIAGFVAATYLRGVSYMQIPTTLLAMVDSSIGGKVGINVDKGENVIGTFYQPKGVIIDIETLKTLPRKEMLNGLSEIIKCSMVRSYNFFEYLEKGIGRSDDNFYLYSIERCCRLKARIVELDEKELEFRKILNYGHIIGHAIEANEKYKISHGEAVAVGMAYEGLISFQLGLLKKEDLERQNALISRVGFPTRYEGDVSKLIEVMKHDKKRKDKKIHFVLPKTIGEVIEENGHVTLAVDETLVRECLNN